MNDHSSHDIPWAVIIIAFATGIWPLGVGLLLYKLNAESKNSQRQRDWLNALNGNQAQGASGSGNRYSSMVTRAVRENRGSAATVTNTTRSSSTTRNYQPTAGGQDRNYHPTARQYSGAYAPPTGDRFAAARAKIADGKILTIVGLVLFCVFGFATANALMDWLPYGYIRWAIQDAFLPFVGTGIGAGMFAWGRFKARQSSRFHKLLSLIGDNKRINIKRMAKAMPCSYNQACDSLQDMIDDGLLGGNAYIDMSTGYLVLDGKGMNPAEQPEPRKRKSKKEEKKEQDADEAILAEIRRADEAIPDEVMSRKIQRIEESTRHILDYQKKHPEKAGELRKFLNYYLPTTLKILNAYAELEQQGVEGENISATKKRIEDMMDNVVKGFEKQLDDLFKGDMLDITSDIAVMEKMLSHDGLAGGMQMPKADGIHLTLEPDAEARQEAPAAEAKEAPDIVLQGFGGGAAAVSQEGAYRLTKEQLAHKTEE